MKKTLFFLAMLCSLNFLSRANNISVTNVSITGNTATFTLSWENSWNTTNNINPLYPNNYDGVWLFMKYQNNIDNLWKHAKLSSVSGDHSVTGGGATLQVEAVSDSMGVFIRRSNAGAGNISNATVTLAMGPQIGTGVFNFKVFGIEMVNIPTDTFQLGDGNSSGSSYILPQTVTLTKENANQSSGTFFTGSPLVPAAFPLGYNAFWSSKYEVTTEQWVDFLNTLTYDQQDTRTNVAPNSATGTNVYGATYVAQSAVEIDTPGLNNTDPAVYGCDFTDDNAFNQNNDGQNIPMMGISHGDFLAYLDWAGLRPITETEYEKICRGNRPRVQNEYAWGSSNAAAYNRVQHVSNGGTSTEALTPTVVNGRLITNAVNVLGINGGLGPVRAGAFATGTTGRESSGAGFYGNMELSGNQIELCIRLDALGVQFNGTHGDGTLSTLGEANTATWPTATSTTGIEERGGEWYNTTTSCRTSLRGGAAVATRSTQYSGRGARTQ